MILKGIVHYHLCFLNKFSIISKRVFRFCLPPYPPFFLYFKSSYLHTFLSSISSFFFLYTIPSLTKIDISTDILLSIFSSEKLIARFSIYANNHSNNTSYKHTILVSMTISHKHHVIDRHFIILEAISKDVRRLYR